MPLHLFTQLEHTVDIFVITLLFSSLPKFDLIKTFYLEKWKKEIFFGRETEDTLNLFSVTIILKWLKNITKKHGIKLTTYEVTGATAMMG